MDYHIARNNQKLGVFPEAEIRTRLQSGELLPSDLVWCEGMPAWKPAAEVFQAAAPVPPAVPPVIAPAPEIPQQAAAPGGRPSAPLPPKPDNYLVWSILATILCCIPFGIVSIVYATQVDSKYAMGDYAGAQASAGQAKVWFWVAVLLGGLPLLGAALFFGGSMLLGLFGGLAGSGFHP